MLRNDPTILPRAFNALDITGVVLISQDGDQKISPFVRDFDKFLHVIITYIISLE